MDPHRNDKFKHMENKLETVWSTEIDEYFEERYGIDIHGAICDEILKAMQSRWTIGRMNENEDKRRMRMDMDDIMKNLDVILDKYGITENRDAIKDDIYHNIIVEVWCDGRQTGRDTYWKLDD